MRRHVKDIRKLNGRDHTNLHRELSQVLMQIWDNKMWITAKDVSEISNLFDMYTERNARLDEWHYISIEQDLNIALMSIWVEQERIIPNKELIKKLEAFIK